MPEVTPKPPEVIQAQIAAYAAEQVELPGDEAHINRNIGSLALEGVHDISRSLERNEYLANNINSRIDAGTERVVATGQDYTNWLREVGGSRYEPIQQRAQLLTSYKVFKPEVDKLRESAAPLTSKKEHPDFIGNGLNISAFKIEHDGKEYAVRLSSVTGRTEMNAEGYVRGAMLAANIPHLEHMVAMSYEDGVTVAELMPGKDMKQITAEEFAQVTDVQLENLVDTLIAAQEAGVNVDPKPSNYFYDPKEGFGIIDLGHADDPNAAPQSIADKLIGSVGALDNAGIYGFNARTHEDYAHLKDQLTAIIPVIERYDTVLQRRFSGVTLDQAEEYLQDRLNGNRDWLNRLSNPEWVNGQVQANMDREEQWRQAAEAKRATGKNEEEIKLSGWDFV